jgi:E3 ubiquitin-protein ligase BRE1
MLTSPFKSEKSLFAELEKLSTAWEALDRQVKNKVFDLSSLEDRLSRSSVEVCIRADSNSWL